MIIKKKIRPTYLNLFGHVTGNKHLFCLGLTVWSLDQIIFGIKISFSISVVLIWLSVNYSFGKSLHLRVRDFISEESTKDISYEQVGKRDYDNSYYDNSLENDTDIGTRGNISDSYSYQNESNTSEDEEVHQGDTILISNSSIQTGNEDGHTNRYTLKFTKEQTTLRSNTEVTIQPSPTSSSPMPHDHAPSMLIYSSYTPVFSELVASFPPSSVTGSIFSSKEMVPIGRMSSSVAPSSFILTSSIDIHPTAMYMTASEDTTTTTTHTSDAAASHIPDGRLASSSITFTFRAHTPLTENTPSYRTARPSNTSQHTHASGTTIDTSSIATSTHARTGLDCVDERTTLRATTTVSLHGEDKDRDITGGQCIYVCYIF